MGGIRPELSKKIGFGGGFVLLGQFPKKTYRELAPVRCADPLRESCHRCSYDFIALTR
jgi:hypothetical protein